MSFLFPITVLWAIITEDWQEKKTKKYSLQDFLLSTQSLLTFQSAVINSNKSIRRMLYSFQSNFPSVISLYLYNNSVEKVMQILLVPFYRGGI